MQWVIFFLFLHPSIGVNHSVFQILTFVDFFHIRNIWKSIEKKQENPPDNFCSMLPIMHSIDSYSVRPKYHLTIKKPCMYAFLRSLDFSGVGYPTLWLFRNISALNGNFEKEKRNETRKEGH